MKQFILKNDISEIEKIHLYFEDLTMQGLIQDGLSNQLILVIEEMFTNIINYAFADKQLHCIEINLKLDNNDFIIQIIDDGIEFDPLNYKVQDLDTPLELRQIGGLGIHLMKSIMNEYQYKRENNKNYLSIKKYLTN
ncbi:MAG TPA: ATP-binding protein [Candidatus Kapabacteria bacterium]|nr:ATP-binding protein [Candidatus Kapabacteria bacterium]